MTRHINWWLLLSILAIATIENGIRPVYMTLAQTTEVAATCNPDEVLQNRMVVLLEQARTALEHNDGDAVLRGLEAALPFALQLQNTRTQADVLQQWLLDASEGYPTSRLQRVIQSVDAQQNSAQIQSVLEVLLQLANRLPAGNSFVKTRSLAAIAQQQAMLEQPEVAAKILEQARQAASSIQGGIFTANALIDVAEAYAAIDQSQSTQTVLAQIERSLQQVPPNTSDAIKVVILERMAATYAEVGEYAKAQQIVAQFPQNSDAHSVALRGVVGAYIADQNLEMATQLTQSIAAPSQRVPVLGQLAVAYHEAGQSEKVTQLLQQAVQLAQTPEVERDPILQDYLIISLVTSHLQAGRRDEALRLVQTSPPRNSQTNVLKAVLISYSQAGQDDRVEPLLSEQLTAIRSNPNDWEQRSSLTDLLQTAAETQQFEWIRKEWNQIAAVDYGPQDWQMVTIATAYAKTGQHEQAVQWAQQLPLENRPVLRVKLLAEIARVAHESGATEWATNLLQQTLQRIDSMSVSYQQLVEREGGDHLEVERFKPKALATVALVYSEMGQAATMRQLLEQVNQLDSTMSDPSIASPVDNPFAMFMEAEQYVGALQLAEGTKDSELREARLQDSATGLLKQNRFDLVVPVTDQLTIEYRKTQLLLAIAQRYSDLGQTNNALSILARAFQVAKTIPGEESRVDRFGVDGLTVLESPNDRGSFIEAIALQYAQLNQPDQASVVANSLQERQTREQVIRRIRCVAS